MSHFFPLIMRQIKNSHQTKIEQKGENEGEQGDKMGPDGLALGQSFPLGSQVFSFGSVN